MKNGDPCPRPGCRGVLATNYTNIDSIGWENERCPRCAFETNFRLVCAPDFHNERGRYVGIGGACKRYRP